jgi:hypothetical protein
MRSTKRELELRGCLDLNALPGQAGAMVMHDITTDKAEYEAPVLECQGRLGDLTGGLELSGNTQDFWGCYAATS